MATPVATVITYDSDDTGMVAALAALVTAGAVNNGNGIADGINYNATGIVDSNGVYYSDGILIGDGSWFETGIMVLGAYYAYGILDSTGTYAAGGLIDPADGVAKSGIWDGAALQQTGIFDGELYHVKGIYDEITASFKPSGIFDGPESGNTGWQATGIFDGSAYYGRGMFGGMQVYSYQSYGVMDSLQAMYEYGILDNSYSYQGASGLMDGFGNFLYSWSGYGIYTMSGYSATGIFDGSAYFSSGILDSSGGYFTTGVYDPVYSSRQEWGTVSSAGVVNWSGMIDNDGNYHTYGLLYDDLGAFGYAALGILADDGFHDYGVLDADHVFLGTSAGGESSHTFA